MFSNSHDLVVVVMAREEEQTVSILLLRAPPRFRAPSRPTHVVCIGQGYRKRATGHIHNSIRGAGLARELTPTQPRHPEWLLCWLSLVSSGGGGLGGQEEGRTEAGGGRWL